MSLVKMYSAFRIGCRIWKLKHGGATKRHLNYHRNTFSSSALMITPMSQIYAKRPFLLTFEKRKFYLDFDEKLMICVGHIKRIQKKF